ncbi:hypothetical protein Peur_019198 [Populus x canadensis]
MSKKPGDLKPSDSDYSYMIISMFSNCMKPNKLNEIVSFDKTLFHHTTLIISRHLIASNNRLLHHGTIVLNYLVASDHWHPHRGNLRSLIYQCLLMLVLMMMTRTIVMYLS